MGGRFRRNGWRFWLLIGTALYLTARAGYSVYLSRTTPRTVPRLAEGEYIVKEIPAPHIWIIERTDAGRVERARTKLLAVDLPSPAALGMPSESLPAAGVARATEYARKRWLGQRVRIELGRRQLDRDGTLLITAYHGETMAQEALVRQGWLAPHPQPDDLARLVRRLEQAHEAARTDRLGFWHGQLVAQPSL